MSSVTRKIKENKRQARIRARIKSTNIESIQTTRALETEPNTPVDYSKLAGYGLLYSNNTLNVQNSLISDQIISDMALPLIVDGLISNESPLLLNLTSYSSDQITLHLSGDFDTAVVFLQMNNNDPESTVNNNWLNVRKITLKRDELYNKTIKCSALGYRFVIDSMTKQSDDDGLFGRLGALF